MARRGQPLRNVPRVEPGRARAVPENAVRGGERVRPDQGADLGREEEQAGFGTWRGGFGGGGCGEGTQDFGVGFAGAAW